MPENKAQFVADLFNFYVSKVYPDEGITDMKYIQEGYSELVYVCYGKNQKRFGVAGDNHRGILIDFVKFLNNFDRYEWLKPNERKVFE